MLPVSFRSLPTRSFPAPRRGKPALAGLAAALIVLAGCGSGQREVSGREARTVVGAGYRFDAPSAWRLRRSGRNVTVSSGAVDLVGVTVFPLARRYEPRLWTKAVPALDRAAAQLAAQLGGRLEASATVVVGGHRARQFEIGYRSSGRRLVERTAFILDGRREYQLLCRFEAGADDGACRTLFRSFRPG
jgi:hypothetical protein